MLVETFIAFRPGAAHYSKVGIQPELFLESILERGQINRIQFEPFELRVSRAYAYSPDADVLLIANHGLDASVLDAFEGYAGLVLAGTGLGHVSTDWIPKLRGMIDDGTTVVMTSQCLHGRVCDRVYNTGRDLLRAGVIEGEDMLPEVALVKLMWVLGNEPDPERAGVLMQTDLAGEIRRRSI